MASVTRYVSDTLRLTVNLLKSAVDRPMNRKFLGFTAVSYTHLDVYKRQEEAQSETAGR